ncbi:hypothetical protein [Lentibacillus sp. CBA3610]|uniref:hypothetical protein n=1 Tax=Lentibacillus sp. CBA3610 TaxID=2518176 RepID=UPI001595319C|nr:hypothetical protein [Lentibacillus sp. CBA3610]QKY68882.1 hypothetical protein Len3610_03940 [Lentibacillus sp. CBA3610]
MGKIFALILLFLLTACTEEPVITKSDSPPEDPDREPEIIEEENDDNEEVEEFIEFALPEEEIMINLKLVPILDSYLQAAQNKQQAIEQMTLIPIHAADKTLYLLEFSCQEALCSYLLLDQTEENRAYLMADLAKLTQKTMAPDNTKMLFHFDRKHSSQPPLSDIVVMDLEQWEHVTLHNQTENEVMLDYTWPILTVEWNEDISLTATVPDIIEPSPDYLNQWENTEKPTTEIEFTLNTADSTE